ncbi:MAG: N-acetyltransferase [Thermodesulfobacteriota bacterium]|nr:N-acetyltransferase [Thermodesulfobacteriota bacterium]
MPRKPIIQDVISIHKILSYYVNQDILLPRSIADLYEHIRDFYVEDSSDANGDLIGICSLIVSWEDLGEIRSLSVIESSQNHGIGSKLVEKCLEEAVELGLSKVFALTLRKNFFADLGFKEINKTLLPHKIWADCIKCPKFPNCDEIAMIISV